MPDECVCDVIELNHAGQQVYHYRCSSCGACYQCKHKLVGYTTWICPDGRRKPTTPDPGVLVRK